MTDLIEAIIDQYVIRGGVIAIVQVRPPGEALLGFVSRDPKASQKFAARKLWARDYVQDTFSSCRFNIVE